MRKFWFSHRQEFGFNSSKHFLLLPAPAGSTSARMGLRRRSAGIWLLLSCSLVVMVAVELGGTAYLRALLRLPRDLEEVVPLQHGNRATNNSTLGTDSSDNQDTRTRPLVADEMWKKITVLTIENSSGPSPLDGNHSETLQMSPSSSSKRPVVSALRPPPSSPSDTATATIPASSVATIYSVARTDRSGSAIHDMVLALAYAKSLGANYGGACPRSKILSSRKTERETLIRELGLQHVLKFACPRDRRTERIVQRPVYWNLQKQLLTTEFLQWLWNTQVAVTLPSRPPRRNVVAHIRRGDVSPCGKWADRYSPNSHYRDILKRHIPRDVPVTIYSESFSSPEPWDEAPDFANYTLLLDTDVTTVWRAIASAQYVVLSKSTFSYTPALLNPYNATVLYTPFGLPPLPGWIAVGDDQVRKSQSRVQYLTRTRCGRSGSTNTNNVTSDYWHWRQRGNNSDTS